jgi:undecaprenyl phosphate N,N'-diacetylbacillosamine 1-phosphate transferase
MIYNKIIKRGLDLFAAIILLILTTPITLVVGILIYLQNKQNVFFTQSRPGLNQKSFKIYKFKTMTDQRDEHGDLLPDNQRITKLGKLVRKLSIDELPQLFNVLKGEMSLIGPRPLLHAYIPLYSPDQLRRHTVRPGISGWAQVNGRNAISWTKKFELDLYYVDHISFSLDLKIVWLTVIKVFRSDGVNQTADRPMNPFNGNN